MKGQRYSYAQLGMLLGLFVGGGLAVILIATTGNAVYFGIVGIGLALGLGLGAAGDGLAGGVFVLGADVVERRVYFFGAPVVGTLGLEEGML